MIIVLEDVSLVTSLWSTALHAWLLAAGQTDLVVVLEVVTGFGRTGGDTGLVAGPCLTLHGWNTSLGLLPISWIFTDRRSQESSKVLGPRPPDKPEHRH